MRTASILAAAAVLAACGGGGGTKTDTATPTPASEPDPTAVLTPAEICTNVERVVRADPDCMAMPTDVLAQCESRLSSELDAVADDADALAVRQSMFQCMGRAGSCDGIDMCIDQLVTPPPTVHAPASDEILVTGVLQCDQPVQWFAQCVESNASETDRDRLLSMVATASQSMVAMAMASGDTADLIDTCIEVGRGLYRAGTALGCAPP
jgi:hypothetical protein